MNYIPGRVYRHKSRAAKRYIKRQQIDEVLFSVVGVGIMAVVVAQFVGWWIT